MQLELHVLDRDDGSRGQAGIENVRVYRATRGSGCRFQARVEEGRRLASLRAAISQRCDLLVVQHVGNLFGGGPASPCRTVLLPMFTGRCYELAGERVPTSYIHEERVAFQRADVVITPSQFERDILTSYYGVESARLQVVPRAVDSNHFSRPRSAPSPPGHGIELRLLSVGAIRPQKNHQAAVHAVWTLVETQHVDARLDIVGHFADAKELDALRAQIERLGVAERVTLHGQLEPAEVSSMMRDAHVLVCPSRVETFGRAVHEALAGGLPVVAYDDLHCLWENCTADDGLFGVPRVPGALARAIKDLVDHGDRQSTVRGVSPTLGALTGRAPYRRLAEALGWVE